MKTTYLVISLLLVLVFTACEKDNDPNQLIGYWVSETAEDSLYTYKRSTGLLDNEYGFAIKPQQRFIERKNSGWCGTPPISYADFEGTWTQTDSLINITVDYWGGVANYQWRVVSIDNETLKIIIEKTEHHYQE